MKRTSKEFFVDEAKKLLEEVDLLRGPGKEMNEWSRRSRVLINFELIRQAGAGELSKS